MEYFLLQEVKELPDNHAQDSIFKIRDKNAIVTFWTVSLTDEARNRYAFVFF